MRKIRSAKGEHVDFDILKIKEQIASAPPPKEVRERKDFVDRRLRRRLKTVSVPTKAPSKDPVKPKMPETEELSGETKLIDEVKEEEQPKTTKTRQKARPAIKKLENNEE